MGTRCRQGIGAKLTIRGELEDWSDDLLQERCQGREENLRCNVSLILVDKYVDPDQEKTKCVMSESSFRLHSCPAYKLKYHQLLTVDYPELHQMVNCLKCQN